VVNLDASMMTCLTRIQDLSKQQVPSIATRLRQIYVQVVKALLRVSYRERCKYQLEELSSSGSIIEWTVYDLMRPVESGTMDWVACLKRQ
jgi:hypothetical protein